MCPESFYTTNLSRWVLAFFHRYQHVTWHSSASSLSPQNECDYLVLHQSDSCWLPATWSVPDTREGRRCKDIKLGPGPKTQVSNHSVFNCHLELPWNLVLIVLCPPIVSYDLQTEKTSNKNVIYKSEKLIASSLWISASFEFKLHCDFSYPTADSYSERNTERVAKQKLLPEKGKDGADANSCWAWGLLGNSCGGGHSPGACNQGHMHGALPDRHELKFPRYHLWTAWPWASHLTLLSLNVPSITSTSLGCHQDGLRCCV